MKEKELVILRGIPASGKTTFAHNWVKEDPENRIRVNRDDIRKQLGPYWIPSRESLVTEIEKHMIQDALFLGYSVVVDATNFKFNPMSAELTAYYIKTRNIKIVYKDFFNISLKDCILRDSQRENPVGKIVIEKMYHQQLKLIENENNKFSK